MIWIESTKNACTYDENGNKTSLVYYKWDTINKVWIFSSKHEYSYNNGEEILDVYLKWDNSNAVWNGNYKYEYSYDSNGNNIESHYYNYSNGWILAKSGAFYYSIIFCLSYSEYFSTHQCNIGQKEMSEPHNRTSKCNLCHL